MRKIHITVHGNEHRGLEVQEELTIGQWKAMLESGEFGEKILYAKKLTCHDADKGPSLADTVELPESVWIAGPASVGTMLDLLLKKKLGAPAQVRPKPKASPKAVSVGSRGSIFPPEASKQGYAPPFQAGRLVSPSHLQRQPLQSRGSDDEFEYFCMGMQGHRPHMEDRFCAELNLPGFEHAAVFGVFDGHGGHDVSECVASAFPRVLSACASKGGDPANALIEAFRLVDKELWESKDSTGNSRPSEGRLHAYNWMGTTAVVVLALRQAGRRQIFCANCGDSRAVLCRGGEAVPLSDDHKPQNPEERSRIEAANGVVGVFGPCWRIDAGLNLSRALGDFAYKSKIDLPLDQQKVISVPDIQSLTIQQNDEFVVMGSDGVFDVLSNAQLVSHFRGALDRGESLDDAVKSALVRVVPGGDNVTICIARFLQSSL